MQVFLFRVESENLVSVPDALGRLEQDAAVFGFRAEDAHFAFDRADVHGRQVDATDDLFSDQVLGRVKVGDLSGSGFYAELLSEVDGHFVGRFAGALVDFHRQYGAGAHIDFVEVVDGDFHIVTY